MRISRSLILSSLCLVSVAVLIIENIFLFALNTNNAHKESETDQEFIAREVKRTPPTVLSLLHQKRRYFQSSESTSHPRPHTVHHLNTAGVRKVETVNLQPNTRRASSPLVQEYNDGRIKSDRESSEHKVFIVSNNSPNGNDYDGWENVFKSDNDVDYPFYSNDQPRNKTPIPQEIRALFPTNFTGKTMLYSPVHDPYHFKMFRDVFTNKNIKIFELLARWENLALPFLSRIRRLKINVSDPPIPRTCNLTPGPHLKKKHKSYRWRKNAECFTKTRELTPFELDGNHILFTIRTSADYHSKRLPVLFHTWLANVNRSNVVIVTDGVDPTLQYRSQEAGMRCLVSVAGYDKLCDKAGDEISLMFLPESSHYQWFCHVDDDMYVNLDRLVDVLGNFGREEPVYFGRAGTKPGEPRRVSPKAKVGVPGTPYHFAVGGMYCLNRPLLSLARRWIG
jgi:hypothetical protein